MCERLHQVIPSIAQLAPRLSFKLVPSLVASLVSHRLLPCLILLIRNLPRQAHLPQGSLFSVSMALATCSTAILQTLTSLNCTTSLTGKNLHSTTTIKVSNLLAIVLCGIKLTFNCTAGIGTYHTNGGPINRGFFGNIKSNISKSIDSGFATTFDAHVIAGYRFVMRYYREGDKIYIFGFSRGAFTARFLARMIYRVGLLSEGNEEMIPFAYDLYHQYVKGKINAPEHEGKDSPPTTGTETDPLLHHDACAAECSEPDQQQINKNKLNAFKTTFCRSEGDGDQGIKVHFLGMFDCVSSVSVLDSPFGVTPKPVSILGTAHHVRHAVAVDERRVKFKAALLHQDNNHPLKKEEDIKEVWFPGNHGDVGGGWPAPPALTAPMAKHERSWWRRIFTSSKEEEASNSGTDPYQMSDVPLAWMIRELELIGEKDPASALKWNTRKDGFKRHFFMKRDQAYNSPSHDTLKISGGSSLFKVMLWNFMGESHVHTYPPRHHVTNRSKQNGYRSDAGNCSKRGVAQGTSGHTSHGRSTGERHVISLKEHFYMTLS